MSDPIPQSNTPDNSGVTPEVTPPPVAPPPARSNPVTGWFSRVTLTQLTVLLLAAVFIWQWLDAHSQLSRTEQEVARRLSEVEAANKANQILVAQNQELVRELGGKLSLLENKYAETQNQRTALETLYREMSSGRDQTALAEVEQMLLIAEQQLQLNSNVKAALIAMQQADSRLQGPAFAGLKRRIGSDIDKLRALPNIDAMAISARLDSVIGAVDTMELAQDARIQAQQPVPASVPPAPEGMWQRFWREVWQDAKHLVRIENTGQQEMPLLAPPQTFFLRENLKLHLLTARLALLTRDEVSFRRDLKTAQEWLKRYFNTSSANCAEALAEVQKLAASNIAMNPPDLSGSLEAVRNYRVTHERSMR